MDKKVGALCRYNRSVSSSEPTLRHLKRVSSTIKFKQDLERKLPDRNATNLLKRPEVLSSIRSEKKDINYKTSYEVETPKKRMIRLELGQSGKTFDSFFQNEYTFRKTLQRNGGIRTQRKSESSGFSLANQTSKSIGYQRLSHNVKNVNNSVSKEKRLWRNKEVDLSNEIKQFLIRIKKKTDKTNKKTIEDLTTSELDLYLGFK